MSRRLEFHQILIDTSGVKNVYFQPPETVKMNYPAIIYSRSSVNARHANNELYKRRQAYRVIVVDSDPDSEIPDKISQLPLCRFESHYTADNLNHDVFNIFY